MTTSIRRRFSNRLLSALIFATGAFLIGATILSTAAGPISSPKAIVARVVVGCVMALLATPVGLFISIRFATIALCLSALVAAPSFIGSVAAHLNRVNYTRSNLHQGDDSPNAVFRDERHRISFRYPQSWEAVQPQSPTTLVLLYARDGSSATCNLSVIEADAASAKEYNEEYFLRVFAPKFKNFELKDIIHRESMGRPFSDVIYESNANLMGKQIAMTTMATIAIEDKKRFMLIVNVPTENAEFIRPVYEIMASTIMFDE